MPSVEIPLPCDGSPDEMMAIRSLGSTLLRDPWILMFLKYVRNIDAQIRSELAFHLCAHNHISDVVPRTPHDILCRTLLTDIR